jgi:hypothetical protein
MVKEARITPMAHIHHRICIQNMGFKHPAVSLKAYSTFPCTMNWFSLNSEPKKVTASGNGTINLKLFMNSCAKVGFNSFKQINPGGSCTRFRAEFMQS